MATETEKADSARGLFSARSEFASEEQRIVKNPNYSLWLCSAVAVAMAACGSDNPVPPDARNPEPELVVMFPPPVSLTDADSIVVRGTASDADGIQTVRVNDQLATTTDDFATWELRVALHSGPNELVVTSVDYKGGMATRTLQIRHSAISETAHDLAMDTKRNRAIAVDDILDALVAIDLVDGNRTILSDDSIGTGPPMRGPRGLFVDAANDRALVVDAYLGAESTMASLMAVDLNSGNRTLLSASGYGDGPSLELPHDVVLQDDGRALVVDEILKTVVAIDLVTGDRTVLSSLTDEDTDIGPQSLALTAGGDQALVIYAKDQLGSLVAVNLDTGDRTVLSDQSNGNGLNMKTPHRVLLDDGGERALVADIGKLALFAIDLATGDRMTLSNASTGTGPDFNQPLSLALDVAGNRALIYERTLKALLAVDLDNGNRSILSRIGAGTGPPLRILSGFTLDIPGNRAFVVDTGIDAVIVIDLDSGNRRIVSDAVNGTGPPLANPSGLVIEADNNRLLLAQSGALLAIDLNSGNRTVVSDANTGEGPLLSAPEGAFLDTKNNRLLVCNNHDDLNALIAIDLVSGDRSVLSGATIGTGPALISPLSVSLDLSGDRALVSDYGSYTVVAIDLATGNRTIFPDDKPGSGPSLRSPTGVVPDPSRNRILVGDTTLKALLAIDMSSGERTMLSNASNGTGPELSQPIGIALNSTRSVALVSDAYLPGLVVIDLATGDRVIASR